MGRSLNKIIAALPPEEQEAVNARYQELKQEARDRGVDIVMYGHTHKPVVDQDRDIIAVNPGSLTYPRQEGRSPSYIVMTITDGIKQDVSFEIRYL